MDLSKELKMGEIKVKELIVLLAKLPEDAEVFTSTMDSDCRGDSIARVIDVSLNEGTGNVEIQGFGE